MQYLVFIDIWLKNVAFSLNEYFVSKVQHLVFFVQKKAVFYRLVLIFHKWKKSVSTQALLSHAGIG